MAYKNLGEILKICEKKKLSLWQYVVNEQSKETLESDEQIRSKMAAMYQAMKASLAEYDAGVKSNSKMSGGDGEKLHNYNENGNRLLGAFMSEVIENAVKTAESNACMKRIVAAPTAGSCGVIPAVFITYQKHYGKNDEDMINALLVSSLIGCVIAENACIAGAQGGCQAEIGSASAMAAGGVVFLEGGSNEAVVNAVAFALKNMMGLVCDPVAGLVEVPCVKRNAAGALNAVLAAQSALAGIKSVIPVDEVIEAMYEVGCSLPSCLRETSQAGLAVTPTAQKISKSLKQQSENR